MLHKEAAGEACTPLYYYFIQINKRNKYNIAGYKEGAANSKYTKCVALC
jgi:hypothetical protein